MLTRQRGLTLIELMVVVAIMGTLLALTMPSLRNWSVNAQIRNVGGLLQSNMRNAQSEAVRNFRRVVFFRTASIACDNTATASSTGTRWVIKTIPLMTSETSNVVQCGVLSEGSVSVSVTGPTAVCFGPNGRPVAVTAPAGLSANCTVGDANGIRFAMSSNAVPNTNNVKLLQLWVTMGGSVRLCDSKRALSDTMPDGCPTINLGSTT